MKHFINFVFRYFLPILGISLALLRFFFPDFIIYFYGWAYLNWILAAIILLFILLSFYGWYGSGRERLKEFKKSFQVYKKISKLTPYDFGIFNYYETYIYRESDTEAEKSLKEKGIAFITGKPGIGKTRGAFEVAKKLKDYYLLKPAYEKIEIRNLRFPHLFSQKKIILFLDDLEKYAGKFGLDELIAVLKKNSNDPKVLATCRTGKEFEQAFGQKEMGILLSQCQGNKVEPRILDKKEEKELAKGIGRKWEEVTSDGTPGSIVLGLDQMEKRYKDLEDEPKTILHILKLLREANIFIWTEELLRTIAKSKIFELKVERYQWDNWLKVLQGSGFIYKSDGKINISHDSYLDNKFITDYPISDSILIELKDELFALKDAENLFNLGYTFDYRKNLNEGIDCYSKSIKINSDYAEAHNNLGILLYDLKNYSEAEKEYRTAIKLKPDNAKSHTNLGILYALKNSPEAEREFQTAIKINPDDAEAHYNLGVLLDALKNSPEAEREYRTAIELNPDYAEAHTNLGIILYGLKNYPEAEKEYHTAIKIKPDLANAHTNLGNLLKALKNSPEAEQEYRAAIKINPDDADAHHNLGVLLYDLKNSPEAEQEFRAAIKINPDYANAHYNLGNLLRTLKNYPEAEKEYRAAIKLNPDSAEVHTNLGIILYYLKSYPEAEQEFRAAIKINPDYAKAHYNLGILLSDLKNYPEAEQEYRAAIKINPDLAEAYANFGLLYIEMVKKEEAKKELQKAKELFMKQGREKDVTKIEDILKILG